MYFGLKVKLIIILWKKTLFFLTKWNFVKKQNMFNAFDNAIKGFCSDKKYIA